jgi:dynein heavy chain, axonemal
VAANAICLNITKFARQVLVHRYFDPGTHEWQDGILAKVMRTVCRDESSDQKWITFDGPVDTLWIESMNTLLDDNKLLTLLSGERISMPPAVSILFEVEDLSQASPATVSRAGMIYLNVEDLGWQPFVQSWLQKKEVCTIACLNCIVLHNHVQYDEMCDK